MKKSILICTGAFLLGILTIGRKNLAQVVSPNEAVVCDTIVYAPRNDPPVRNHLDFELVKIDGRPIIRETPPLFQDVKPGALVAPGTHRFQVNAFPLGRRPNTVPAKVTFTATVEPKKRYLIGSMGETPILVEEHRR